MRNRRALWTLTGLLLLWLVSASGCATGRTVLVSEGTPMRIGPEADLRSVYVLVDGAWLPRMLDRPVPEGWYVVPPSFVKAEDFK